MNATNRLVKLEARINAMAQAWLYLAAAMEMHGANLDPMKGAMCKQLWPSTPEIEAETQVALRWLSQQLTVARNRREACRRDRGCVVH